MKRFYKGNKNFLVIIDVDERLTPDDNWRSVFYNFYTLDEIASHIVFNLLRYGKNSFVEGVGDEGLYNPKSKTGGFEIIFFDERGKNLNTRKVKK